MSKNTDAHIFFSSRLSRMWLTILWHCCIVEWPPLNPNWCNGNSSSFGVAAYILVISSLSKILERSGSRLIGLYELVCCGGFPGLAIIITRAYFHWSGKCPRRKMLLYIIVSSTTAFRGSSFNTLPVMRSYPGAL